MKIEVLCLFHFPDRPGVCLKEVGQFLISQILSLGITLQVRSPLCIELLSLLNSHDISQLVAIVSDSCIQVAV